MPETANWKCPRCDRPALDTVDDELADYECGVCGKRVREVTE